MGEMSMPHASWSGAAAVFLGMWIPMMVPMMLPSLMPMLARYHRTISGLQSLRRRLLPAVVALGYFTVWFMLGLVAFAASAVLAAADTNARAGAGPLPFAAGTVLLMAGMLQLSSWKSRQLVRCREASECGGGRAPDAMDAWRHGLRLGVRCALCCSGLMMALLAVGMMNLVAMVLVTLAITAERLARAPERVARVAGLTIVMAGVLAIARI